MDIFKIDDSITDLDEKIDKRYVAHWLTLKPPKKGEGGSY